MKNSLDTFLTNCRHRKLVTSPYGDQVSVKCGRCPDCLNAKFRYLSNLTTQESENNLYALYFTLKYDEVHVPKLKLVQRYADGAPFIHGYDITERPVQLVDYYTEEYGKWIPHYSTYYVPLSKKYKITRYVQRNGIKTPVRELVHKSGQEKYNTSISINDCRLDDPLFQKFYEKTEITSKQYGKLPRYTLRYIRNKDGQDFIKRLRFQISLLYDEEIRYFLCSEYGPTTFRPHFHGILFYNSHELHQNIKDLVNECWSFGSLDTQFVTSAAGCCKYVAAYCNSLTHCPDYLRLDGIAPRSFHSRYFGACSSTDVRDFIYEDIRRAVEPTVIPTANSDFQYTPTAAMQHRLFPRPYNFRNQTDAGIYKLYTIYDKLITKYPTALGKVSELTKSVLCDFDYGNMTFMRLLNITRYPCDPKYAKDKIQLFYKTPEYYTFVFNDIDKTYFSNQRTPYPLGVYDEDDIRIYTRIYSAIALSKHFLTFCCQFQGIKQTIELINGYYDYSARYRLKQQYKMMEEYNKTTLSTDYSIFFHNVPDYEKIYKNNTLVRSINDTKDSMYRQRVKHKELNDANLIFVDVLTSKNN